MNHICRCGRGFDTKEEKFAHMPGCLESRRGKSEEGVKIHIIKRLIRTRLIAKGKYTEANVDRVFNEVTDNGKNLLGVELVTDANKIRELNSLLKNTIQGEGR